MNHEQLNIVNNCEISKKTLVLSNLFDKYGKMFILHYCS